MQGLAEENITLDINIITVVLKRNALKVPIDPSSGRITHNQNPIRIRALEDYFVLRQKSSREGQTDALASLLLKSRFSNN